MKGGGSTAAGAATVTHKWTTGNAAWTSSGVDIQASILGFEVGTFTKSTGAAPATQVVPHGLGQPPKALILWTEARPDTSFSGTSLIAFRAAATGVSASGSVTINKPTGTVQNDVMVAGIAVRPNTATITAPAGWTLLRSTKQAANTANQLSTYWKLATASEPASYTFTVGANAGAAGGIASFSGVDPSDPIDVENGQTTASATTSAARTVTTTSTNDMIVTVHGIASSVTWTPPTGMTEAADATSATPTNTNGESLEINYVAQAGIGATGTKTANASGAGDAGATDTIALKPAYQSYFGFGLSDGTTSGSGSSASQSGVTTSAVARRMANKVLTVVKWDQTLLAEADLSGWDTDSFTLKWTTNDSLPYTIHYLLIGGTDVSAKVLRWQMPTAVGNVSVTGTGFQPTAVIHLHTGSGFTATPPANATNSGFGLGVMDFGGTQWATEMFAADAQAGGDTQRAQATDAAILAIDDALTITKKGSLVSMDANGFTINFGTVNNTNAGQIYSLALFNVNVKAGSFLKTTAAAPASQSITGTGFEPSAVFFHSFQDVAQASPVKNSRMSYGASDVVTEGASAFADLDLANPTNFSAIDKTTKTFVKVNNSTSTVDAEADLTSLDPDGFTMNWTTNDAVATQVLYMGLANLVNTEVKLVSFSGTRYSKGALLQWKTGAELNNLGFNLYRDVNGVRTKVNASLIAGSGLSAGQNNAVNTELSYARWDLDAAATTPGAVYWLEDVDMNGHVTTHGPITPTVGAVNAPEPTMASSSNLSDLSTQLKDRRVFIFHDDQANGRRDARMAAAVPGATSAQWTLAGQAAVKIGIDTSGWYRVQQGDLVAAGLDAHADPRNLRLFVDGLEQAIRVNARVKGRFSSGDSIEFYATGLDTPYSDTRIYWLVAGAQAGQRITDASYRDGGVTQPANFLSTVRRKDRSIYFAALENGDKENWFGPLVPPDQADLTLTADNLDASAGGAQLTVTLQGVTTAASSSPNHLVAVLVNGTEIGQMTFAGQTDFVQTFALPMGVLVDGDNDVQLVARNGDADYSLIDELALTYPHTYRADADLLHATVANAGPVTIGGFADSAVRVVDVTNPAAAIELTGITQTGADGFSSLTVRASGDGARTLLAFSESTIAWPRFIEANHPSTWHDASQSHDYVIVTHPDFAAQAAPLAELRRQQGHTPAIVDVNDIYDEFSFGEKTPQAIRDFLQWAKKTWRQAPRFVVLLGDATIDPRDYAGMGDADFVPTKQVPMAGTALETASDDWFVDFDSNGLPDVPIGRLSVRTPAQAAAAVAKIVNYEHGGAQRWTKNVLLVSGQSDSTTNFGQFSSALGALTPHDYTVQQVSADVLGSSAAHQAIADRVNEGQLIVNYAGHGSVQLWGTDGQLLTNTDVTASWRNASRLPFVIAMNCLNGLFSQIWDEESLAESLQRAPDGGAVAVWASSATTPASTQALVNQELFRLIFSGTYATLGEAIAAAKRVVGNPDLRRSWIFFGDPAMQLNGAPAPGDGRSRWTPPTPTVAPATGSASANDTAGAIAGPHTIGVAANGDLQSAINRASAGDTIALEPGATFVGNFVLPAKSGANDVTIRTATPDALLPGAAARIDASNAPLLAKIQSPNGRPALSTAPGAHHYRLLFLEFKANANGAGDIVALGDGSTAQQSLGDVPHDLVIDRCYIHGDARLGQRRGISLNSASTSIVNSYIADIKATDATAQAISGWNGPGPFTIVNNYLEAAGSNFVLGGADAANAGLVPADVTFRFNYLSKSVAWRSQGWRIKNLIELRDAVRVSIDGNVLEHNGTASPAGSAVLVMPRSVDGAAPWSRVEHVQFTNNSVRRAPAAIDIIDPERTASDIVVHNNLFTDVSAAYGGTGRFLLITGGLDVAIDHNTVIQDGPAAVFAYGAPSIGFTFTNNIVPDNGSAVSGDGVTPGSAAIAHYFPGAVWIGNVIPAAPAAIYPTGNWYPASLVSVGFVNFVKSDYRLAPTSVYRGTATDGNNPGYDAEALAADVPVSVLACPTIPTIASPAVNRIALSFPSPLLLAGAAPSGISCVGPTGSLFSVGATTVNCTAFDMLARSVSCSTIVTVQGSFDATPVSGPVSGPVSAPPVAPIVKPTPQTPTTPTTMMPTRNQPAAATTPNSGASSADGQTTSLGTSFERSTSSPVTATASEGVSPLASLAAIYGTVGVNASTATAETTRPSIENTQAPVSTDSAKPSDSKEPKDSKPSKVKSVELKSDVSSPQVAGATITLTAAAVGGVGPYQYQWRILDNGEWSMPTDWAETATFTWTATKATAELAMMVNVRSAGSGDETPEATKTIRFVIKPAAPVQTEASAEPGRANQETAGSTGAAKK